MKNCGFLKILGLKKCTCGLEKVLKRSEMGCWKTPANPVQEIFLLLPQPLHESHY